MQNQKHVWSEYQKLIFKNIANGTGNTIIIARAGAAKSSSIIEGTKYVPKGKSVLFCAFNKSIQEELKNKLGSWVSCFTLHSLGFRGIKNKFPKIILNNYKCFEITSNLIGNVKENYDLIDNLCKAVHFCKMHLADTPSIIEKLIDDVGIDICEMEIKKFVEYVVKILRLCKEKTTELDFDDMLWFCFVYHIDVGKYDYVFIDEGQDMSKAAIELALSAVKKDGRVIAVLDNLQAIYGFLGADSKVLDNLRIRLKPNELKLPISYRCPIKIIDMAKQYAEDIQAYDKAIEGEVIEITMDKLYDEVSKGSYIVSRLNAPIIKICFALLKKGIPANLLGRDIADGLFYLIKKSKKKTIPSLITWLKKWEQSEKEKYLAKRPNADTSFFTDKFECLYNLCEDCETLEDVKKNISSLFTDKEEKDIVLCGSTHKMKGKEAKRVFLLKDTYRFNNQEEKNLYYIGITRTLNQLYLVSK